MTCNPKPPGKPASPRSLAHVHQGGAPVRQHSSDPNHPVHQEDGTT